MTTVFHRHDPEVGLMPVEGSRDVYYWRRSDKHWQRSPCAEYVQWGKRVNPEFQIIAWADAAHGKPTATPDDLFTANDKAQLVERDPSGADRTAGAVKMDAGKAPVAEGLLRFVPRACLAVANHWALGRKKYPNGRPLDVVDGEFRYENAEARHICKAAIEGDYDLDPTWKEFGEDEVLHATAKAWNAMVNLELVLRRREAASIPTKPPGV